LKGGHGVNNGGSGGVVVVVAALLWVRGGVGAHTVPASGAIYAGLYQRCDYIGAH